MKRLARTHCPLSSAGRIVFATWSARAAASSMQQGAGFAHPDVTRDLVTILARHIAIQQDQLELPLRQQRQRGGTIFSQHHNTSQLF